MAKLISLYKNGNYYVELYDDGTKIRQTIDPNDTEFVPQHPESIDLTITKKCDGGCPWCYMNCTPAGKHAELLDEKFLNGIHPEMEIAINGNDLTHPQLESFLLKVKDRGAFVNITVNMKHFMRYDVQEKLFKWQRNHWFWGLGISWDSFIGNNDKYFKTFLEHLDSFKNVVIHTIAGILTRDDLEKLGNHGLKILILGYKNVGNGVDYGRDLNHAREIFENQTTVGACLKWAFKHFEVVSFDNLALEQLCVKDIIGKDAFNNFYMGDEGTFTFYIDLVDKTFSMSSMCKNNEPFCFAHPDFEMNAELWREEGKFYETPNASIDQMFHYVRKHRKEWE